jgi:nucleoside-diphosphate-sugar epimerase
LYKNKICFRDYIYIYDIVDAFLLAGLCDGEESYYVLGCDEKKTISDVWHIISDNLGGIPISYNDLELNKMETRSYIADYSKFKDLTGWYPKFNIERGIRETIKVL